MNTGDNSTPIRVSRKKKIFFFTFLKKISGNLAQLKNLLYLCKKKRN